MAGKKRGSNVNYLLSQAPVETLEQRLVLSASVAQAVEGIYLAATPLRSADMVRHAARVQTAHRVAPPHIVRHAAPKATTTTTSTKASSGATKTGSSSKSSKTSKSVTTNSVQTTTSAAQSNFQPSDVTPAIQLGQQPGAPNNYRFHGDAAGSGDNQNETVLTPSNVASNLNEIWQSSQLDGAIYATPLYEDSVSISGSGNAANHTGDGVLAGQGKSLGVVFAATGGGSVYAIAAQDTNGASGVAPGTILWKTHLGNAYGSVDGNSIGVLATPVIDMKSGRIYIVASVTDYLTAASDPNHGANDFWVFALSIHDGSVIPGYPLAVTQTQLDALNQNTLVSGPNTFPNGTVPKVAVVFAEGGADQRGALNLSADGSTLYVDYACYGASNPGWMTTTETGITNGVSDHKTPGMVSSYSSIDTTSTVANGGMWGAGGPSIDPLGNIFVSTGDNPSGTGNPIGTWGNSVLEFGPGQTLALTGVYTPWNYPAQDTIDSDLGGGSPIVVTLPAGSSSTTDLVAVGGKQGNGYLLNGGLHLNNPVTANQNNGSPSSYPADLSKRPPSGLSPSQDPGLFDTSAAGIRNYWQGFPNQVGPLALFQPYNETSASNNTAKARDTPATFAGPDSTQYVIWAGATKSSIGSSTPVAPSMYLTKIVHTAGQAAYLQITAQNTAVMSNPGSNMITSNGTANEIDWIVDAGVQRGDSLNSLNNTFPTGAPVLYAYNALTMQPIWSSAYEQLQQGGKYNSIAVARGNVFVGTNRIQAFGLTADTIVDDSVQGTGLNQFNFSTGWTHVTGSSVMATFDGTVSNTSTVGSSATLQFNGSGITVYADETASSGSPTETITVDGVASQSPVLQITNTSPNGQGDGDVPIYTISGLSAGTHILKIVDTTGTVSVDRVEIAPPTAAQGQHAQISVSATDGNTIPAAAGLVPYTINYNNLGVAAAFANNLPSSTTTQVSGTNAAGVVVTETVPTNTTFDATNSTSGWTLSTGTGTGGAGTVYTYSVGALNAGITGSVIFSVDLNNSIPVGTTSITNSFSIADGAGDSSSGSRSTAIPPPAETKLIFLQNPPGTVSGGVPISPAVTVEAEDQFNNIYSSDSSSIVTLTLNTGTIASGATAQMVNGIATFSNTIINTSGTYTLTANDTPPGGTALTNTTSGSFVVAASSKLGFIQQPTQTSAGTAVNPAVTVAVENQAGQTITTDNSIVTLALDHGAFMLGGATSTTITSQAVNGIATFNNIILDTTGSYTLIASDGTLQHGQSNSFSVVTTGNQLIFTQQPETTVIGQGATAGINEAINPAVMVSVEDQFGNVATGDTSIVTVALSSGTLLGGGSTATVAAINGVATFANLVLAGSTAGTYTLLATDPGLTQTTSHSFTTVAKPLTVIDDNNANNTGSIPQVTYAPAARWIQSSTSLSNNYKGTITTDSTGGDNAQITFTGNLISVYALGGAGQGQIQVGIDGNSVTIIDLSKLSNGIQAVYTSGVLTNNPSNGFVHTIEVEIDASGSGSVSLDHFVVGPASATLQWATPTAITYGTPLNTTQLDAFNSSSDLQAGNGTFTYSPVAGTILPVGVNTLGVTFTPTDTTDYNTTTASVQISVLKATPVITWDGPEADLIYEQTIGATQLNATATINGATVPGTFVYFGRNNIQLAHTNSSGQLVIDNAVTTDGVDDPDYPLSLIFTPTDTTDVNITTADQDVDTDPGTPIVSWPSPATITDSTPLSSTQLDATATYNGSTVSGNFAYTPAANSFLAPGTQTLGVFFTPTDAVDLNPVTQTTTINVVTGPVAKLAFTVQPSNTALNTAMTPVKVAVEDSAGFTVTSDTSIVTLTLSGASGTTYTAHAVNGVATFSSISIGVSGSYTLTASDPSLTGVTSNPFQIGTAVRLNFNTGAVDAQFAPNFSTFANGGNGNVFSWSSSAGIQDVQEGQQSIAGGGVISSSGVDTTAAYNQFTVNLSDGAVHTESEFVTFQGGLGTGDKPLQIGYITQGATYGLNGGFSFISARLIGNGTAEFQSGNGSGTAAVSSNNSAFTGTVSSGDWLQLTFTTKETASGAFAGTFAVVDYGPTGVAVGRIVLAPVSYTVAGLTTVGTASAVVPAFRTATSAAASFDDFSVDSAQTATKIDAQQEPSSGTAGILMSPNPILDLDDANGQLVLSDNSVVTLTASHDVFANNGSAVISATAVNGVATFPALQLNADGTYILKSIAPSEPAVDLHFDPVTINGPVKLAFMQGPTSVHSGLAMSPPVTVAIEDTNGTTIPIDTSTVSLTLSSGATFASTGTNVITGTASGGIASFSNMVINAPIGSYTMTASCTDSQEQSTVNQPTPVVLTPTTSSSFSVLIAEKLAFTHAPTDNLFNTAMNPTITVAVQDTNGNTITTATDTITLTLGGGNGFFTSNGATTMTAAAVSGVATFTGVAVGQTSAVNTNAAGYYTLTATDTGLSTASNTFAIQQPASGMVIDDSVSPGPGAENNVAYSNTGNVTQNISNAVSGNIDGTMTALKHTSGSTANGGVTARFTGSSITLFAIEQSTSTTANVSLDNGTAVLETIPAGTAQFPLTFTPTSFGFHTLAISYPGTRNSTSQTYMDLDGFKVTDGASTITAASPNSGSTAGGKTVVITGTGFTTATAVKFGTTSATTFTINSATQITAVSPAGSAGTVFISVTTPAGGTSMPSTAGQFVYVAAPNLVGSPVINGDNPNGLNPSGTATPAQRSMVEDIVYTFDSAVTIPNAANAFTVAGAGLHPGTAPVSLSVVAVAGSNNTQWAVILTGGAAGTLGSIANGEYTITVNGAGIFSATDGATPLVTGAGRIDKFYRLFGDAVNGDRTVNASDNLKFKGAINGAYNPIFDVNGDGSVNAADNLQFKNALSIGYSDDTGFVPTI